MSKNFKFIMFVFLSLPKTLYFCFKTLPFNQAIKLPILIGWNTKINSSKKGIITFANECAIKPFCVRIGFGGSDAVPQLCKGIINIESGKFTIKGRACFAAGSSIDVSGNLEIGSNFSTNKNAFISCSKEIIIGNDVMLGWNVKLFDASGHTVYVDGIPHASQAPIIVGNHVWLCSETHLLKGAQIGNGSIVAWRSLVNKDVSEPNVLIAGNPAVIKKSNISWGPFIQ